MNEIKLSVRSLVEYTERSGDIDDRFRDSFDRAKEGRKIHRMIQEQYGQSFSSEVPLKNTTVYKDIKYTVQGRADGIGKDEHEYIIDEIKSTTRELDELEYNSNKYHWAQVKCYGYFFCKDKGLDHITLQLSYYQVDKKELKIIKKAFNFEELENFYISLLEKYAVFTEMIASHIKLRDESISNLVFPYPAFRKGQRYLSANVYKAIEKNANLLAEAATGIGKTISTLFPAIKALGENLTDKIFYLTSKSTQKKACLNQVFMMKKKGLDIRAIEITAKNKICLNDQVKCNPDDCPYAKGHFDRVNAAIIDIFDNEDVITDELVRKYALKHKVCPLELELDLTNFCDLVICDYNYVFDPTVYLKRYFDEVVIRTCLLVDESHNLVSRGRDMYSYELFLNQIEDIAFKIEVENKIEDRVKKSLMKIAEQIRGEMYEDKNSTVIYELSLGLIDLCMEAKDAISKLLIKERNHPLYDKLLDLFFDLNKFIKISDYYDESFVTIIRSEGEEVSYKLSCLDTHTIFKNKLALISSAVFFSATLSPLGFFADMFGLDDYYNIRIESPFPKENLRVNLIKLSTRYKDRERNKYKIAGILKSLNQRSGNKLIFFPSYGYMKEILDIIDFKVEVQEANLSEKDRLDYLSKFKKSSSVMGFCVLGGVFSEGIDLIGDRLETVAVISVGLPGISLENDLIKEHFNALGKNGFNYAYLYPGMNKVHQAGGRLIRDIYDTGDLYLIDDRFDSYPYLSLLPKQWRDYKIITNINQIK
ncbi:MAG: ATP-dependent DNA helicase [Finegoldia sp.]|nr:ATP-dependent DNA helicase [Finegoldia sp.]